MKDEFTMTEYIEENKLGVSSHDAAATKMISDHLKKRGYVMLRKRRNGKVEHVWSKGHGREGLKEKLGRIK